VFLKGVVTTFCGSSIYGYADGTGTAALFNGIAGIAMDSSGTLYLADKSNHVIRKVTTAGQSCLLNHDNFS
jgi:hypothetical protein